MDDIDFLGDLDGFAAPFDFPDEIFGSGAGGDEASRMATRLRTVSELRRHNVITPQEQKTMKHLVLSRNPDMDKEIDQLLQQNNTPGQRKHSLITIKETLRRNSVTAPPAQFDYGNMPGQFERGQSGMIPVYNYSSYNPSNEPPAKPDDMASSYPPPKPPTHPTSYNAPPPANYSSYNSPSLDDAATGDVKQRKNERERQRRMHLSTAFAELFELLKIDSDMKMDKASVLNGAADRLRALAQEYRALQQENMMLKQRAMKHR